MYRGLSVSLPLSLGVTPDTNAPRKCRLPCHLRECHGVLLLTRGKRQRIRQHIFFLLLLILSCSGRAIPGVGGRGGVWGTPLLSSRPYSFGDAPGGGRGLSSPHGGAPTNSEFARAQESATRAHRLVTVEFAAHCVYV